MKKYLMLLLLSIFLMGNVKAQEAGISYERLGDIYFNITVDGNFQSNHVTSFHLDDRIAYCIEPGVAINTSIYDVNYDWESFNFSPEVLEYIEKVGYYGYEYPGHGNNYYYIAAQELIWKAIHPSMDVVWTSGINMGGSVIDVSNEKNEIIRLVNEHSILPSFAEKNFSGYIGDEIVLEDENDVLSQYDISSEHDFVLDGNTLSIKLEDDKAYDFTLIRKYYDASPLLVYSRGDSQKLAALRITLDKESVFSIKGEEKPIENEVIEVPDTFAGFNFSYFIGMIFNEIFV